MCKGYSELNLSRYRVALPYLRTVCGSPPCPGLNEIHCTWKVCSVNAAPAADYLRCSRLLPLLRPGLGRYRIRCWRPRRGRS
ncbi:hypothetical protein ELB75_07300 [Eikenella corrodens]|uniref:Uncharacterized protein n=1 Tax=Eikenella corrodens TaxID=539 RepID=A0A3S9SJY7_EIKCO|nr:hypothetical protein ELB75_07300 [Eikenella corrodens]